MPHSWAQGAQSQSEDGKTREEQVDEPGLNPPFLRNYFSANQNYSWWIVNICS